MRVGEQIAEDVQPTAERGEVDRPAEADAHGVRRGRLARPGAVAHDLLAEHGVALGREIVAA